ncbi:MAG TPA: metal ABC transporter permease, partial [Rhizomicrobium sp.]|nr:metal ABC transporter permease [Rhizomicrobium sp.]
GQILWVLPKSLIPVAVLYAAALVAWFGFRQRLGQIGFYVLFALVVTQSVQLVGVYLVFASLIVPALAAKRFAEKSRLWVAYAVGLIGYVVGLIASSLFDLPTGAVIVVSLLLTFILAVIVSTIMPVNMRAEPTAA